MLAESMANVRARRPYIERISNDNTVTDDNDTESCVINRSSYYYNNDNDAIIHENRLAEIAEREKKALRQRHAATLNVIKSISYYTLFITLFLLLPLYFIVKLTPFFIFENLQCRLVDKVHSDRTVVLMEQKYAEYFNSPPLYGTEAYNKSMWWGTYEPSKIFAVKNRAEAGSATQFGIAWYDTTGKHPVRHLMYTMHNKVNPARQSIKSNRDPEVMRVKWVAHDGIHYAKEYIEDFANKATLEVEFLKSPSGNTWHIRLHASVESDSPIDVVLYLVNDEVTNNIDVEPPQIENNGDWSPKLKSLFVNHNNEVNAFALRVYDDHNPLFDTAPWRVYGVQVNPNDAFAISNPLRHGGGPAERAALEGKGLVIPSSSSSSSEQRTHESEAVLEQQQQKKEQKKKEEEEEEQEKEFPFRNPPTTFNLRDLPHNTFTFIDSVNPNTFKRPLTRDVLQGKRYRSEESTPPISMNMVVLKKTYDSSFRLEVSFTPLINQLQTSPQAAYDVDTDKRTEQSNSTVLTSADHDNIDTFNVHDLKSYKHDSNHIYNQLERVPEYESLSTCQLTNIFRHRDKAIISHARKVTRPWVDAFNRSHSYYELLASQLVGELFGSMSFTTGKYLLSPFADDTETPSLRRMESTFSDLEHNSFASSAIVSALASLGSRTDDPVGTYSITGLQLLFLIRWNKEVVKDVLASWLISAQDAQTGFIPTHTTFNKAIRSLTMPSARVENANYGNPPTILFGLEELLQEMTRKEQRIKTANKRKRRNTREYYEEEKELDKEFLQDILEPLKKWRQWWHTTQCGGVTLTLAQTCHLNRKPLEEWPRVPTGKEEDMLLYRWRGRRGDRLPTSGMEDYPRSYCTNEAELEGHLDLFTWIAMLSRLISKIEIEYLHIGESVSVNWEAYLNTMHWDSRNNRYADRNGCVGGGFSPYVGYVNLFPVITGVVRNDSVEFARTLAIAQNDLMSEHGLLSVSFDSVKHARENQLQHAHLWMGYVWPSVNTMFLYSLKTHYFNKVTHDDTKMSSNAEKLYHSLRIAMTETMHAGGRWWEFYNPVDGRGEGSKTYIGSYSMLLTLLDRYE